MELFYTNYVVVAYLSKYLLAKLHCVESHKHGTSHRVCILVSVCLYQRFLFADCSGDVGLVNQEVVTVNVSKYRHCCSAACRGGRSINYASLESAVL